LSNWQLVYLLNSLPQDPETGNFDNFGNWAVYSCNWQLTVEQLATGLPPQFPSPGLRNWQLWQLWQLGSLQLQLATGS